MWIESEKGTLIHVGEGSNFSIEKAVKKGANAAWRVRLRVMSGDSIDLITLARFSYEDDADKEIAKIYEKIKDESKGALFISLKEAT